MKRAISRGINTPNIIAASYVKDKYLFRYIIMDYIDGQEADKVLSNYSSCEKHDFVHKLKENLYKLNSKPIDEINNDLIKERAMFNERWDKYSHNIKAQIADILKNYNITQSVYVHGDITADNVIIDKQGNLFLIDFADSTIAPAEYEYPPIIFDLFNFDIELIHEFIKGMDFEDFIEILFNNILLHDFGASFVKIIYEKYTGKHIDELSDIYEIKRLIYSNFKI